MIETGILFDEIHSFHDLNLVLSGCEIPPAKPKTNYVEIPGADGSVDLTEAIGEVKYNDRDGCKFTFTMLPNDAMTWEEKKTEVSNLLNGKKVKITLDKDDEFYYTGRCTVDSFLSDKKIRQIVVTARVSPYKLKQVETVLEYQLSETAQTIVLQNSRKSVSPYIETSDDNVTVIFGLTTFTFEKAGQYSIPDILLVMGDNVLTAAGSGKITFRYREGDL